MNLFEYLLECGFWQWVGNIMLAYAFMIGCGLMAGCTIRRLFK